MRKTIFSLVTTVLVLGTGAAAAAPALPGGGSEVANLVLTVEAAEGSWKQEVLLSCPGEPGVGHPHREAACADLEAVEGDLDALHALPRPSDSRTCVSSNDPVVATARGTYRGRPVNWSRSYEHGCAMQADTAGLFVF